METEQILRIKAMEQRFDTALERVKALQQAADAFEELKPALETLTGYYELGLWRGDYLDDEAGLLPEGLKRGVLSEDGIYNLLTDITAVKEQLRRIGAEEE